MYNRKSLYRNTLIAWGTITAIFSMYSINLNNAQAEFLFETRIDHDAGGVSAAIGDLDGDGNMDIVTDGVSVLLGNGDGIFQNALNYDAGSAPVYVAIGDLNGDASPDLAVANYYSDNVSVLINTGQVNTVNLLYTPATPCRIVDNRKTVAGIIGAFSQRNFRVFGSGSAISAQGGDPPGCTSPMGDSLAAHINMIAVNPTGKDNLQAFPADSGTGAGLSV